MPAAISTSQLIFIFEAIISVSVATTTSKHFSSIFIVKMHHVAERIYRICAHCNFNFEMFFIYFYC